MSAPLVLGWCIPERADRPSTADRRCVECGYLLIPPSFGVRTWRWIGGTWEPYKPRPDGWHWTQPTDDKPRTTAPTRQKPRTDFEPPPGAPTVALTCAWCKRVSQVVPRGGSPQKYCPTVCKDKATTAAAAKKRAARQAAAILEGVTSS